MSGPYDGKYDILLLQIDCDDEYENMFGDSGNCYFLISKEDLKNKNFDRVLLAIRQTLWFKSCKSYFTYTWKISVKTVQSFKIAAILWKQR
ncbi:MAG: DUF1963 domain-containing protein [Lachnospiraceae bacterium]|nr:DUF1963 domain-containing protein [Lachnospiraceae bacterium]